MAISVRVTAVTSSMRCAKTSGAATNEFLTH
jgi:hypothetical protein